MNSEKWKQAEIPSSHGTYFHWMKVTLGKKKKKKNKKKTIMKMYEGEEIISKFYVLKIKVKKIFEPKTKFHNFFRN